MTPRIVKGHGLLARSHGARHSPGEHQLVVRKVVSYEVYDNATGDVVAVTELRELADAMASYINRHARPATDEGTREDRDEH